MANGRMRRSCTRSTYRASPPFRCRSTGRPTARRSGSNWWRAPATRRCCSASAVFLNRKCRGGIACRRSALDSRDRCRIDFRPTRIAKRGAKNMRRSAGLEKWWIAGALAVLLAAGSAQAQDPVKGGSLVVARVADIFTFDPYNTQDDRSIFTELTLYDRLVKLSPDGKKVEPELATAWTIAPDGLTADFTLRDGVKFSDGSPLTAEDVVFSLSRAIDQKGSWGFLFQPVKSVAKVNDKTVRLTMCEPFAPLLPALSTFAASIYQKANFEKQGDEAGEHPLGTGAFMLDHWDKGQQVVLKRNPNYWQEGKPYLDEGIFRTVGDDNARALQLASGEVQLITDVPVSLADQVAGQGGNVATVKGSAVGFITINEKVKPLDDAAARCALAYAIDRDAIAKTV